MKNRLIIRPSDYNPPIPGIVDLVFGLEHVVLVENTGKIYSWGNNFLGQVGANASNEVVLEPFLVNSVINEDVIFFEAKCSQYFNMAKGVDQSGNNAIFMWGSNTYGQMGQGHTLQIPTPSKIKATLNNIDYYTFGNYDLGIEHVAAIVDLGVITSVNPVIQMPLNSMVETTFVADIGFKTQTIQMGINHTLYFGLGSGVYPNADSDTNYKIFILDSSENVIQTIDSTHEYQLFGCFGSYKNTTGSTLDIKVVFGSGSDPFASAGLLGQKATIYIGTENKIGFSYDPVSHNTPSIYEWNYFNIFEIEENRVCVLHTKDNIPPSIIVELAPSEMLKTNTSTLYDFYGFGTDPIAEYEARFYDITDSMIQYRDTSNKLPASDIITLQYLKSDGYFGNYSASFYQNKSNRTMHIQIILIDKIIYEFGPVVNDHDIVFLWSKTFFIYDAYLRNYNNYNMPMFTSVYMPFDTALKFHFYNDNTPLVSQTIELYPGETIYASTSYNPPNFSHVGVIATERDYMISLYDVNYLDNLNDRPKIKLRDRRSLGYRLAIGDDDSPNYNYSDSLSYTNTSNSIKKVFLMFHTYINDMEDKYNPVHIHISKTNETKNASYTNIASNFLRDYTKGSPIYIDIPMNKAVTTTYKFDYPYASQEIVLNPGETLSAACATGFPPNAYSSSVYIKLFYSDKKFNDLKSISNYIDNIELENYKHNNPSSGNYSAFLQYKNHSTSVKKIKVLFHLLYSDNPVKYSSYYLNKDIVMYINVATNPAEEILDRKSNSIYQPINFPENYTSAQATSGPAFVWGNNDEGQLGKPKEISHRYRPQFIMDDVKSIACGYKHTILVDDNDGKLWATGLNDHGQLGLNDRENRYEFTEIKKEDGSEWLGWDRVVASGFHTFAIQGDNTLYAFGLNNYGQLGLNNGFQSQKIPTPVISDEGAHRVNPANGLYKVNEISTSVHHTITTYNTSEILYTFGLNNYNQLGTLTSEGVTPFPKRVNYPVDFYKLKASSYVSTFISRSDGVHIHGLHENILPWIEWIEKQN